MVETGRYQVEAPDAIGLDISRLKAIAHGKNVVRNRLTIEARNEDEASLGDSEHLRVGLDNRERFRVQRTPIDDRAIIDGGPIGAQEK
jgi:hypothetical protein